MSEVLPMGQESEESSEDLQFGLPRNENRMSHSIDFLWEPELELIEQRNGRSFEYRRRAGQWHCSSGPAIVNLAGRAFMIHGYGVSESAIAKWRELCSKLMKDPDDPGTVSVLLPSRIPGEPFEARILRTVRAIIKD